MEARRTRRRLLKPRPVAWTAGDANGSSAPAVEIFADATGAPAPARVQMPTPGTDEVAVALPPFDSEPEADGLPFAVSAETPLPPPPTNLTLVPGLAPRGAEIEAIEALEAPDDVAATSWRGAVEAVEAIEVDRSVPHDGEESSRDADTFPMEFEPGESPSSLGVRLFRRLPPVKGLTRLESVLLGAMLTASPLILGGGVFLGWSLSRAVDFGC
jgi:hypothetical protein